MLTIGYITCRKEPRFDWFLESLATQLLPDDKIQVVIVDFFARACDDWTRQDVFKRSMKLITVLNALQFQYLKSLSDPRRMPPLNLEYHAPMPTVWQGPHRLPKENHWAMSSARNTALCYAKGDWFMHLDDRSVLQPGFMAAVREHMKSPKMVFGSYQKRTGVTVENGFIKHGGIVIGEDDRAKYVKQHRNNEAPTKCGGEWYYGCVGLGPLDWYLHVNGWDTTCDGLSFEDVILGLHLANNGFPCFYDYRMMLVEDRTPGHCDPQFKRTDKGVSPYDKSHALLDMLKPLKRAKHNLDLRKIRQNILAGQSFPPAVEPIADFYDGQLIKDF